MPDFEVKAVLILLCLLKVKAQMADFLVEPTSVVKGLNLVAEFHCNATGIFVDWRINGSSAESTNFKSRGVNPTDVMNGDVIVSVLCVPATNFFNNSEIQCQVIGNDSVIMISSVASLQVQGLLAPPDAVITYAIYGNDRANRLKWTPPFTLDITDQDPDISGYTVCTNVTDICYEVSSTNFDFPTLCDPVEFTVTATNIVGEGAASRVTYIPQKQYVKPEGNAISVEVSFSSQNVPRIKIVFNVLQQTCIGVKYQPIGSKWSVNIDNLAVYTWSITFVSTSFDSYWLILDSYTCLLEHLHAIQVTNSQNNCYVFVVAHAWEDLYWLIPLAIICIQMNVSCYEVPLEVTIVNTASYHFTYGQLIPNVTQDMSIYILIVEENIAPDQKYSIEVKGLHTYIYGHTTFNTYDVQEVILYSDPGALRITCVFAGGSLAKGCLVVIEGQSNSIKINRTLKDDGQLSQNASVYIKLAAGQHCIHVFDIEYDEFVNISDDQYYICKNISDTTPTQVPIVTVLPVLVLIVAVTVVVLRLLKCKKEGSAGITTAHANTDDRIQRQASQYKSVPKSDIEDENIKSDENATSGECVIPHDRVKRQASYRSVPKSDSEDEQVGSDKKIKLRECAKKSKDLERIKSKAPPSPRTLQRKLKTSSKVGLLSKKTSETKF